MENKKVDTFVYEGLGFPVTLINVPMKKLLGEWVIDVDVNKLQIAALRTLIYKPAPLTGDELRFIRKFLNMTMTDFGKAFGVTHVAVLKWEKGERFISPPMEMCIRWYALEHLHARDKEFRNLFREVSLMKLSKLKHDKIYPIAIDATDELKNAS